VKRCSRCQVSQPRAEFYRQRASGDGLPAWCKSCVREHKRLTGRRELQPRSPVGSGQNWWSRVR